MPTTRLEGTRSTTKRLWFARSTEAPLREDGALRPRAKGNSRARVPLGCLLAAIALLAGLAVVPGALADPSNGLLTSSEPIHVSGSLDAELTGGAVHVLDEQALTSFTFTAQDAAATYQWEAGVKTGPPGDDTFLASAPETGSETGSFRDVEIQIRHDSTPLEILAFPDDNLHEITTSGVGEMSLTQSLPEHSTRIGESDSARGTDEGRTLGFWYSPPGDWLLADQTDAASVTGDFSLVINNATITIQEGGEVAWENWTGYRRGQDTAVAHTYEERLLVLHVRGAQLNLTSRDQVRVLGDPIDVQATGAVTGDRVQGIIERTAEDILFSEEPMHLQGTAVFSVGKGSAQGPGALELSLQDADDLRVEGGQARAQSTQGLSLPGGMPGLLGGLGLLVLAGVAVGTYPTGAVGRWYSEMQDRRFGRAVADGQAHARRREFDQAAACFKRATDLKPDHTMAWFHLALSHLEADNHARVLEVLEEAQERAPMDELDLLEIEIEATLHLGDHERCRTALAKLADGSQAMAASLVTDLELEEDVLGPELSARFSSNEEPGSLPGYV